MNEENQGVEKTNEQPEEPKLNGTTEEIKTEEKQGCIMNDCSLDRVAQSNYCEGHKKENEAEAQRIEEQAAKQPELPLEPPKEEEKPDKKDKEQIDTGKLRDPRNMEREMEELIKDPNTADLGERKTSPRIPPPGRRSRSFFGTVR